MSNGKIHIDISLTKNRSSMKESELVNLCKYVIFVCCDGDGSKVSCFVDSQARVIFKTYIKRSVKDEEATAPSPQTILNMARHPEFRGKISRGVLDSFDMDPDKLVELVEEWKQFKKLLQCTVCSLA